MEGKDYILAGRLAGGPFHSHIVTWDERNVSFKGLRFIEGSAKRDCDILTAPPPPVPKCFTPIQFGPPIAAAGIPGTGASNGRCTALGAGASDGLPTGLRIGPITVGGRGAGGP